MRSGLPDDPAHERRIAAQPLGGGCLLQRSRRDRGVDPRHRGAGRSGAAFTDRRRLPRQHRRRDPHRDRGPQGSARSLTDQPDRAHPQLRQRSCDACRPRSSPRPLRRGGADRFRPTTPAGVDPRDGAPLAGGRRDGDSDPQRCRSGIHPQDPQRLRLLFPVQPPHRFGAAGGWCW